MNMQSVFPEVVACDERNQADLDQLRDHVAEWFMSLTPRQRDMLGSWVNSTAQYAMFVALAAEAGSWEHERRKELVKCLT
jgi:hypothetical protein